MTDEESIRDALVQISWYLNFKSGEEVTPEEIADNTQIPWAVAYNCIITLKQIQRVCPQVEETDDGVRVRGDQLSNLEDPCIMLVLYMFTQKENTDLTDSFRIDEYPYLRNNLDAIEEAESLGWVEWKSDEEIAFTPLGIGVAGPEHSRIENVRDIDF